MALIPRQFVQNMLNGTADEDQYLTVSFRILLGAHLCQHIEDAESKVEKLFVAAIHALIQIGERFERHAKFGLNGDNLADLDVALDTTDQLVGLTTRRQHIETHKVVGHRVSSFKNTLHNLKQIVELV